MLGELTPTVFYGADRDIRCVVPCDGCTLLGWKKDLDGAVACLKRRFELKLRGVLGEVGSDERRT